MTRSIEIHEDTQGRLSIWRDPYAWVDPFAETEEWALRYAEIRQDSDEECRRVREMAAHEITHLQHQVRFLTQKIVDYAAPLQTPRALVPGQIINPESQK